MSKYLIIADDFTGANDTGVQLKRRGIPTEVVFSGDSIVNNGSSFVIDTESRGMDNKEAYNWVKNAVKAVSFDLFDCVIKKVDSTLRGNIAFEVKGIDEEFASELVIVVPALPDLNRTTINGIHLLNGTPISKTEIAKDPKKPVKEDNITKLFQSVYDEKVIHITIDAVKNGNIDLSQGRVFTFDSITNQDMQNIIAYGFAAEKKILWVGTAAIADNILETKKKSTPSFGLAASLSSVTRGQLKHAETSGISIVKVSVDDILSDESKKNKYINEAVDLLRLSKDTILTVTSSYEEEEYKKSLLEAETKGMKKEEFSQYIQNCMGEMACEILKNVNVSGVFLTGGDTAIGFFEKAKSKGSSIVTEIAIGIPLMRIRGGIFDGMKVITKAGAFGKEDAITYSFRKLKEVI